MPPSILGIRIKSGWASAILLTGNRLAPQFLYRRRMHLADPKVPQSSQPYHRRFGRLQKNAAVLDRLIGIVNDTTNRSLTALIDECRALGYDPVAVGLVVGSTIEPAKITNEHIRAHAYEAQLFRSALERAAGKLGLECSVIRERDLPGLVEKTLGPRAGAKVAGLRKLAGSPWRADEKLATLAAWTMVAGAKLSSRASTRTA